MNVYPFIEAEKAEERSVNRACVVLEVSRAAYYDWTAGPSPRTVDDAYLTNVIRDVHVASRRTYGAPRICDELRTAARASALPIRPNRYRLIAYLRKSHTSAQQWTLSLLVRTCCLCVPFREIFPMKLKLKRGV